MNFLSIDQATKYIKDNLQEFYNNSRVLRDRLLVIGRLMNAAKEKKNQAALGQLIVLQQQTKDLFNEQLAMEQKLAPFAQYFGVNTTLGALPLILGFSAIAVAGGLYLLIEKTRTQGRALDLIQQGLLTPAEAAQITDGTLIGFGGGLGLSLPIVAAIGIGLFWLTGGVNLRSLLHGK